MMSSGRCVRTKVSISNPTHLLCLEFREEMTRSFAERRKFSSRACVSVAPTRFRLVAKDLQVPLRNVQNARRAIFAQRFFERAGESEILARVAYEDVEAVRIQVRLTRARIYFRTNGHSFPPRGRVVLW